MMKDLKKKNNRVQQLRGTGWTALNRMGLGLPFLS